MAHQTRHPRRILAPPPPELPHPVPDSTSPATIQAISHRFSKLYANHKTQHQRSIPTAKPYQDCSDDNTSSKHPQFSPSPFDDNGDKFDETEKDKERTFQKRQEMRAEMIRGNDKIMCSGSGVKVMAADMPSLMQIHALDCAVKARHSLQKFTSKTLALTLKKEFDGAYGPAWHCIVGTSFGSFVTHSVGGFIYFSLDPNLYVLLFQTSVRKTLESN